MSKLPKGVKCSIRTREGRGRGAEGEREDNRPRQEELKADEEGREGLRI